MCCDYREIPTGTKYNKIVSLEMAEVSHHFVDSPPWKITAFFKHVGIRRYSQFLSEVYDLLHDDGIFVLQVAGIRPSWQYEDLIW